MEVFPLIPTCVLCLLTTKCAAAPPPPPPDHTHPSLKSAETSSPLAYMLMRCVGSDLHLGPGSVLTGRTTSDSTNSRRG